MQMALYVRKVEVSFWRAKCVILEAYDLRKVFFIKNVWLKITATLNKHRKYFVYYIPVYEAGLNILNLHW